MPVFLYSVTMLISQIKTGAHPDEKNYFKWTTVKLRCYFFFSENAKNLGQSDDTGQRKKQRMALSLSLSFNLIKNQFFEISLSFNLIKNRFF